MEYKESAATIRTESETLELPTVEVVEAHLQLLSDEAERRRQLEAELAELEARVTERKQKLGIQVTQMVVSRSSLTEAQLEQSERLRQKYEEEAKRATFQLLDSLDCENDIVLNAQYDDGGEYGDFGGYWRDKRWYTVVRSGDMYMLQIDYEHQRNEFKSYSQKQWLFSDALNSPLTAYRDQGVTKPGVMQPFRVERSRAEKWHNVRSYLQEVVEEIEMDALLERAHNYLREQELQKGQLTDCFRRSVSRTSGEQEVELRAEYFLDSERSLHLSTITVGLYDAQRTLEEYIAVNVRSHEAMTRGNDKRTHSEKFAQMLQRFEGALSAGNQ